MSDSTVITISGVGSSKTISVESGDNLDSALDKAGVNPEEQGLDVEVNGEKVASPSEHEVSDGDQVVTTPRKAKLG